MSDFMKGCLGKWFHRYRHVLHILRVTLRDDYDFLKSLARRREDLSVGLQGPEIQHQPSTLQGPPRCIRITLCIIGNPQPEEPTLQ